ncbi:MAG: hypothetical protein ABSC11_11230 [Smithella sp.]|jgi:hypothetical protein
MSKFISGKDLLTRFDILSFELFDHVKNGLQPFDKFGRPISPPDIKSKLRQLEELEKKLESQPGLSHSAIDEIFKRSIDYIDNATRQKNREYLLNKIEPLKKELEQIEDKFSWRNYDLPADERSAQWVIDLLLNSYFLIGQKEGLNESIKITESKLQSIRGKKGGEKPKKNQPIILAIIKHLQNHPNIEGKNNGQIAESFKKYTGKKEPIIIYFNKCEWDVYFADNLIWALPDAKNKKKNKDKSIAYSTFRNSYIPEAKKIIKNHKIHKLL